MQILDILTEADQGVQAGMTQLAQLIVDYANANKEWASGSITVALKDIPGVEKIIDPDVQKYLISLGEVGMTNRTDVGGYSHTRMVHKTLPPLTMREFMVANPGKTIDDAVSEISKLYNNKILKETKNAHSLKWLKKILK
jgi:hypothetical protein